MKRIILARLCVVAFLLLGSLANPQIAHAQELFEEPNPVRVETEKYAILFSTEQLSPLQWDILLPSRLDDLQHRERFAIVDRAVVDVLQRLPLRFRLDLANTVAETTLKDNVHTVRFEGQIDDRNLKVIQTYRIPQDGYVSTFTSPSLWSTRDRLHKLSMRGSASRSGRGLAHLKSRSTPKHSSTSKVKAHPTSILRKAICRNR